MGVWSWLWAEKTYTRDGENEFGHRYNTGDPGIGRESDRGCETDGIAKGERGSC